MRLQARVPAVPVPLERLYQALLAKRAEDRPTAGEALVGLQAVAQRLGEAPYIPPEIVDHIPENELAFWHTWAEGYRRFKLYPEALARNDMALRLDPEDPSVLIVRGAVLQGLQRPREAEAAYQQALAHLAPGDRLRRKMVHNNLGTLYSDQLQDYARAEAAYQAVQMPEAADNWSNRANNEARWGLAEQAAGRRAEGRAHLERARKHALEARRLNPQATDIPRLLALIERALGE